jgi:hypothetical protein
MVTVGIVKKSIRHQFAEMVVKKRLPRPARLPAECSENSRDRAPRDLDAEHLQLAMNSRRPPQRIGSHYPLDQSANLDSGRRPAPSPAVHPGEACPELAKALPLPPDDRLGLYVDQGAAPAVPDQ